jgi:glycosyltransferase involved in cell wall biosynthesis
MQEPTTYLIINSLEAGGAETLNVGLAKVLHPYAIVLLENKIECDTSGLVTSIKSLSSFLSIPGSLKYLVTWWYAFALAKFFKTQNKKSVILLASLPRSLDVAIKTKRLLAKTHTIHVVAWEHANPDYGKRNSFLQRLTKSMYQQADAICVNSKNAAYYLQNVYAIPPQKVEVVYNFFDANQIQTLANEPLPTKHAHLFSATSLIYFGRLRPQKGIEFLLEVFRIICEQQPTFCLIFVGKGVLEGYIQQFIVQHKLDKNIHLVGFTTNPFPYVKRANAMVFPSETEGFGNVIVESLLCGTPVIAADIDNGPREILAPSTDFRKRTLVPEETERGLLLPSPTFLQNEEVAKQMWVKAILDFLHTNKEGNAHIPYPLPTFDVKFQIQTLKNVFAKFS